MATLGPANMGFGIGFNPILFLEFGENTSVIRERL